MSFDLPAYLARINHKPLPVSPQGLAALQLAQLRAIPFENTEPLLGRVPDLDPGAIWRKLVVEERGGYCLEVNTLFGQALRALGYRHQPILARVRLGAPAGGPRAHLAQVVTLDGQEWLADAGFGGQEPEVPVPLGSNGPVVQECGNFRIWWDEATEEEVLERETPEGWFALYSFDRVSVTSSDLLAASLVCAHWDKSPFPVHLLMNRLVVGGRASLCNRSLNLPGGSRELRSATDLSDIITGVFGLPVDAGRDAALWRRIGAEMALAS